MYDAYMLIPLAGMAYDRELVNTLLKNIESAIEASQSTYPEFLICRSARHATEIQKQLKENPDSPYPFVAVVQLQPAGIVIYQETTEDILAIVRDFVTQLMATGAYRVVDLAGQEIVRGKNVDLAPLFDEA